MDTGAVVWIVVALVVLALVVVAVMVRRSQGERRVEGQREKAREIREGAQVDRVEVQRREADAAKVDAQARLAQAESRERAADAAALQTEAQQRTVHADSSRADLDERLRQADDIDPDVRTDEPGRKDVDLRDERTDVRGEPRGQRDEAAAVHDDLVGETAVDGHAVQT